MKFAFTEEQEMLRDMIRGALQREAGLDKLRRWTEASDLSTFDQLAQKSGWVGIDVAEAAGGQGGSLIEQAILFEELGRSAAPSGALLTSSGGMLGFAARLASGFDTVEALTQPERSGALCVNAGCAADEAPQGLKQKDGRLTGTVPLVLHAPGATDLLVSTTEADGLGLWRVATASEGVAIKTRRLIDRTRQFGDVSFNEVEAVYLGHMDMAVAVEANAALVLLVAAESLGLARRMLEMTVAYVGERVQFGVPVGSFQAVKHSAAEAFVDIEAAHSGIYYAAWALSQGEADGVLHAWIAKAFATEAAVRTADRALQLHGAIGYTWEYDLQLFYKRAKINLELFGSPRSYRERIANTLLAD